MHALAERLVKQPKERIQPEGLGEEVGRSHGGRGGAKVEDPGTKQNGHQLETQVVQKHELRQPRPVDHRHLHIQDEQVWLLIAQQRQALASVACGSHLVPDRSKDVGQGRGSVDVIVHDEQVRHDRLPPSGMPTGRRASPISGSYRTDLA
jgi:hypothetical protein